MAAAAPAGAAEDAPGGHPIVLRLRADDAPPARWRQQALDQYVGGHVDDARQILEAAVEIAAARSFDTRQHAELVDNMYLLAELYLKLAVASNPQSSTDVGDLLSKAKALLENADKMDISVGAAVSVESFVAKGYHALARHVLKLSPQGDELKRAELLFDEALKMDGSSPKALLGKAVVFVQHREWAKALGHFRQVFRRAAPFAPRGGLRLESLKQLRFALAACFCDLGRHEQMHKALSGAVTADSTDVESLCALAHLEAKVSKDGVGKSLEYLDDAVKADQNHPVVLCHLANHAFYCGLEEVPQGNGDASHPTPPSWALARDLLTRASSSTRSDSVRAEVHYQTGRLEHAQERFGKAHDEYKKCRDLQPEHAACVYGLAQTCIQQRRYAEAIDALQSIRKGRQEPVEVLRLLTVAYLLSGDKAADAVKSAEALVARDKEDTEAWVMRAEAHDQLAAQQPTAAESRVGIQVYEQVAKLMEGGQHSNGARRANTSPQMWNNLGTLRSLEGDPRGAREAYEKGLELAEQKLGEGGGPGSPEEAKDLHIARLTMRFNCAWLAESEGDQPDHLQATQDYMALNQEHNWYTDSLLRLGAQWQRMGSVEIAIQRYQEAMKSDPVLSYLMQAELHRQRADHKKALQSAEVAVQHAGEKQFHYVHVYLGNLYFEVACVPSTKPKEMDAYMQRALESFTKALGNKKDSHYAANGIGMVFARRGKLDFARRTFQSVMQHHGMAGDPSVLINLAHTYLQAGGDNARKALALYERASKMRPGDLSIRMYLAKAHFRLKQFDRCTDVLGDATQIWPEDLVLRYNLAKALESFGHHLVSEERKSRRVVGVDNGMQQMTHAMRLLGSASRLFGYVHKQWVQASEQERARLGASSGGGDDLDKEMLGIEMRKRFCEDMQSKAQEELRMLQARRAEIERRAKENAGQKEKELEQERERQQLAVVSNKETEEFEHDRAKDLEETARMLDLGRNLEMKNVDKKAPQPKEPKEPKPPKEPKAPRAPRPARSKAKGEGEGEDGAGDGERRGRAKKRAEKESRRGRKDRKRRKDRGGRRRRGSQEDGDDASGAGSAGEGAAGGPPGASGGDGEERSHGARPVELPEGGLPEAAEGADGEEALFGASPASEDGEERGRKRKKRGDKEKKKKKKHRRRRHASEDDDDAEDKVEDLLEPPTADAADAAADKAMEEELFGPETET